MKKVFVIITLITYILMVSIPVFASNNVNVIINGKTVNFTKETGYPFIDENGRTMVPLRITMESAGAAVGYDSTKSTAIVITEFNRIEVPIGTSILYNNNVEVQNDTESVVKDGRTYLPIRAVLESADFTVEWDAKTNNVNAYTFKYDADEFVPYSTSSLKTLLTNILNGNVVYINGEYYATPEYIKLVNNTKMNYFGNDLNIALYPKEKEHDFSNGKWISGVNFDSVLIFEKDLDGTVKNFKKSTIDGFVYVYAFYDKISNSDILFIVDELTDEFMDLQNGEGTFNGIRMKKENGDLYFNIEDLKAKNLYDHI